MNDVYNAIIALLNNLFPTDYANYINKDGNSINPIFKGYDNKMLPPQTNNYIILTSISDKNMSLSNTPKYNKLTHKNTYISILSTLFYIDFYGNNSENNSRIFNNLCKNYYANTFWQLNNYAVSINKIKTPQNMSDTFGRDTYNKRFLVELEVFNNVINQLDATYFTDFNINPVLANN